LAQRERLWNEFVLLQQQIALHNKIPPEQRVWNSTEERQWTELARNRCETLLAEIMANDEISMIKAVELKDRAEKDLRRVQLATTVAPAYAKQSQLR
jgi:hypothetical protein